ncbi:hypothetical protein BST11_24325 [Mycobacterium alsense]|uniref:Uncharacterized protein n=1 Tax=Mycobacterium alsense TaxID=324058 RepID=A0AA42BZX1_9MYCO|nr:hypothetical protein [Mycobacterium alsense]MCV7380262.1 hypothetical protein [Mycobacterium alsense]OQZ88119.1 hypothetical protein BST11_24325 [Mycobacterium alsense]
MTVIPHRLEYVYAGHQNGVDAIELRATDRAGVTTVLVLSAPAAQHIAAHLAGMLADLDELRRRYNTDNN